jgi:hypothetical protein
MCALHALTYRVRSVVAAWLLFLSGIVWAGTAEGRFNVNITLVPRGDFCVNTVLSQQVNAVVRVTCNSNLFVSIEPSSLGGFSAGMHGGAHLHFTRSISGLGTNSISSTLAFVDGGAGTTAAQRVFDLTTERERAEMLVIF